MIASERPAIAPASTGILDPRTGLVPPGRFIPILEETGLIFEVGRWALRKAIEDYLRAVNWALDNREEAVRIYAEQWKLPLPVVDSYLLTKKDYLVRRDGRVAAKDIQPIANAGDQLMSLAPKSLAPHWRFWNGRVLTSPVA